LIYELVISPEHAGKPLRSVLQSELRASRRLLRQLIQTNGVLKNGQPARLIDPVREGDQISVRLPEESSFVEPEPMDLDIRYEDDEVLVINKPAGVLTHPSSKERQGSLLAGVRAYLGPESAPHSVHRLDRDTSGLILLAKHAHAHHLFDLALRQGQLHRVYWAFVWSADREPLPEPTDWRVIDLPIAVDPAKPSRRVVSPEGRRAVTHYRIIARQVLDGAALEWVQVVLETGRTHQIRLHMASIGKPLVAERVYDGGYSREPLPVSVEAVAQADWVEAAIRRQALHAAWLAWTHPVTGQFRWVAAEPPADIRALWTTAGGTDEALAQWMEDMSGWQRLQALRSASEGRD
jgi:23S rRNA pseudouridine1911/1915/1917 synthase